MITEVLGVGEITVKMGLGSYIALVRTKSLGKGCGHLLSFGEEDEWEISSKRNLSF